MTFFQHLKNRGEVGQLLKRGFALLKSIKLELPPITEAERTPLVQTLLGIIDTQQQLIAGHKDAAVKRLIEGEETVQLRLRQPVISIKRLKREVLPQEVTSS